MDDPKYGSGGGAYSDWIEIYNPGDEPVSLEGYILADMVQNGYFRKE